jgi:hypothetical protein
MRAQPNRSKLTDTTVDAAVAEHGRGDAANLPVLQAAHMAHLMNFTCLYGLGLLAAWPAEGALRQFGDEFAPVRTRPPC